MTLSRNFALSFWRILLLRSPRILRPCDAEHGHIEPERFYFRNSMTTDTRNSRNFALVLIFYVHLNPPPSHDLNKLSRNDRRARSHFEKKTLFPPKKDKTAQASSYLTTRNRLHYYSDIRFGYARISRKLTERSAVHSLRQLFLAPAEMNIRFDEAAEIQCENLFLILPTCLLDLGGFSGRDNLSYLYATRRAVHSSS